MGGREAMEGIQHASRKRGEKVPERPVGIMGKGSGGGEKTNSKHDDVYVRKCHDETYSFAW